ncbi:hypothetical protein AAE485_04270 [Acidithiobacillus ferriphilus]|uniref:hypothetical protein n=1 Tax=Acidithiobacillus ferriphilus TaxID=1689834 RepID=UPI00390CD338
MENNDFFSKFFGLAEELTLNNIMTSIKGVVYSAVITSIARYMYACNSKIIASLVLFLGLIIFVTFETKIIIMVATSTRHFPKPRYLILNLIFSLFVIFCLGAVYFSIFSIDVAKINKVVAFKNASQHRSMIDTAHKNTAVPILKHNDGQNKTN